MASDTTPKEIYIEVNGQKIRVEGVVVHAILYLANYAAFFNDKRTTGNFLLMCKDGSHATKNEMTLTP